MWNFATFSLFGPLTAYLSVLLLFQVWDIRRQSSISTLETNQPAVSLDIHQTAPVFAVWTSTQNISLHSLYEGKVMNQIRYHEGLLGNRLGKYFV